jgi:hypothetical protein
MGFRSSAEVLPSCAKAFADTRCRLTEDFVTGRSVFCAETAPECHYPRLAKGAAKCFM